MDDIRILIVEEDATEQFAISELAHSFDYETDLVSSSEEAFKFVSLTKYVAILINTEMKSMNGFECAVRIREYERLRLERVPIIGIHTEAASARQDCIDVGMDDVLVKPYSQEQLRQVLLRWAYQSFDPNMKLVENPMVYSYNGQFAKTC